MATLPESLVVPDSEFDQIRALYRLMTEGRAALVGPEDTRQEIPDDVYQLFLRILEHLERRQAVSIVPYRQELSTQTAAELLGVSRQYLVRLVESDAIPFHKVGAHRRIYLEDLLDYKKTRDEQRRAAINDLAREAVDLGVYDVVPEHHDDAEE